MKVRHRRSGAAAAVLAITVGAAPLVTAVPAAADSGPMRLYLDDVSAVVLDETHARLFVAEGRSGPGVVVTDLAGRQVGRLDLPSATGLALTPDGTSLWVATRSELDRVDTRTLQVVQRVHLPEDQCAHDVDVTGTRLAYAFACYLYEPSDHSGGFGVVDAASGTLLGSSAGVTSAEPTTAAGAPGHVYVSQKDVSPPGLALFDVRGTSPKLVSERPVDCGGLVDLDARPGRNELVTSCGSPYQHDVYVGKGLTRTSAYPSEPFPRAGAWSADGTTFVGGSASLGPDVRVFTAGASAPRRTGEFPQSERMVRGGLAVSRDGSRVWAVTEQQGTSTPIFTLRVLDQGPAATQLSVQPYESQVYDGDAVFTEGLITHEGAPVAGAALSVTRRLPGSSATQLAGVTTRGDGTFDLLAVAPAPGLWTYTVTWAGDAGRPPVSSTFEVLVRPVLTRVSLSAVQHPSGTVLSTVTLTADDPSLLAGRQVVLSRTSPTGIPEAWPLVTDASGRASLTDTPTVGTWTYRAELRTEEDRLESSATVVLDVQANGRHR